MSCLCRFSTWARSLFVFVCTVHPPPQLESTTSCVGVGDNGNMTGFPLLPHPSLDSSHAIKQDIV